MQIQFKNEIDVGHVLTLIALAAGFIWWIYTTQREWRSKTRDDARSGALRLLLRLLREQRGVPISITGLYEKFRSDETKPLRLAYCKRDWTYKSEDEFEAAVYRLDWESKIYFVSPNEIIFRLDRDRGGTTVFSPEAADKTAMMSALKKAVADPTINTWDLERLAESCMRVAPVDTSDLLRENLRSKDDSTRFRVASIIGKFALVE